MSDVRNQPPFSPSAARRNERGKIAKLRALVKLMLEPTRIEARFLGVGEFAVARHDNDFLAAVSGDIRPVAPFLPAHLALGFDVPAVYQHVGIAALLEVGDHFHAKPHFRGPESVECFPP